ncbi:unnamed protein product [Malus baccata var. baccata]
MAGPAVDFCKNQVDLGRPSFFSRDGVLQTEDSEPLIYKDGRLQEWKIPQSQVDRDFVKHAISADQNQQLRFIRHSSLLIF